MLPQFLAFSAVGAVGTAFHYATLVALVELLDFSPLAATTFGFLVGATVNYTLNYRLTFRSRARHADTLPRFFVVGLAGACLNAAIMAAGVRWAALPYLVVQLIATALVLGVNFAGARLWAFREHG